MTEPGSSLARMLAILDLFTLSRPEWPVDAIAGELGYPPSTTYRYVRELTRAGLLTRMPGGTYVIGARVIELESLVRHTDPLSRLARPVLRELATETGCTSMLASVYGDHLINVAHEDGLEQLALAYLHGTPLPWFRGSPGKAVLAFLPTLRARTLFERLECPGGFDEARWKTWLAGLRRIRQDGYSLSDGELDPEVIGFGVPLIVESRVIGSISLACTRRRAEMLNRAGLVELLREKARALGSMVLHRQQETPGPSPAPRAQP
jgi:DNA-binding IclR family transcriptional regulator